MTISTAEKRRADRQAAAAVAMELAGLAAMTAPELAAKWEVVTGEKAPSHNRPNLTKRLAWRIQELALGGLSEAALVKINELAPATAKLRTRAGSGARGEGGVKAIVGRPARDPRLPQPGTVLRRAHGGVEHEVTVLADGFEYRGERYRSLSKIAREITGTPWNGFLFWNLAERRGAAGKQVAA